MKFSVRHKIRFDRGRTYYSYMQSILTAFLVYVFTNSTLTTSIIVSLLSFVLIYVMGYADEKFNVLKREQKQYSEDNPILMEILKEVKNNKV